VIEGIDEVSSELQSEPLGNLEVLMQTEVYVRVTRRAQRSELRCAIAEGANRWRGEVSIVGEPLNTAGSLNWGVGSNTRDGNAVGPGTAREGAGPVRGSRNG